MACLARCLFVFICLGLSVAKGQYFPGYYPLDQKLLPGLRAEMKIIPASRQKVQTLLKIASLYLYCTTPQYDSVLWYLNLAQPLAVRLNDKSGFQEQVLLRANVYLNNKDFAEAKRLINLTTDSAKVKLVMRISDYYWSPVAQYNRLNDLPLLDSALHYAEWSFNLAAADKRYDFVKLSSERIWYIAFLYTRFGKHERSQQVFTDFINHHSSTPGYSVSAMYMEMAGTAQYRFDFSEAIRYCILAQQHVTNSSYDRFKTFIQLGQTYAAVKDWQKSIDAYKTALRSGRPLVVTNQVSDTWTVINRIVRYQNLLGKEIESKSYFKDCVEGFPITAKQDSLYYHATLGEISRVDKKYEVAEAHLLKALSLIDIYNAEMTGLEMYLNIIKLYVECKRYDKAQTYISLLKQHHRYQRNQYWSGIHLLEYKIDSANGKYLPAISNYLLSRRIEDSLKSKSQMAEYQNLELKYQTEKKEAALLLKEKDIKLLNQHAVVLHQRVMLSEQKSRLAETELNETLLTAEKDKADLRLKEQDIQFLNKQSKLQTIELKQQAVIRNITIIVTGLLVVIAVLLYRQFKAKQQSEKLIAQKNVLLEGLVEEKNWLLKEMHHRVKNNLQTIVSLLESQSAYLKNSEALSAIQQSQHRIHAMSLIHQKLYRGDQTSTINMAEYVPELVRHLDESFDIGRRILFRLDVMTIYLDVSKVIPVGLIVNEAVTNAIKYAFTKSPGESIIDLSIRQDAEKRVTLVVSDNGSGLPADHHTLTESPGLGIRLMEGLTNDIDGTFSIQSNRGVTVEIVFQAEQLESDGNDVVLKYPHTQRHAVHGITL